MRRAKIEREILEGFFLSIWHALVGINQDKLTVHPKECRTKGYMSFPPPKRTIIQGSFAYNCHLVWENA